MARIPLKRVAALLAVALIGAACGRPDSGFDVGSLEDAIPSSLIPDDPSLVENVSCPEPATSEATTIVCDATIAGRGIEVTAVLSANGTVAVSTDAILLDLADVASVAAERLTSDLGVESRVTCRDTVVVVVVADQFGCTATDSSGVEHELVVTVLDDTGNWSLDLSR